MTRDGGTRKDNPFAKRTKPVDIGKRPSRPKNRMRSEIEEGVQEFYLSEGDKSWPKQEVSPQDNCLTLNDNN
jgi:hypothetical protein